MDMEPVMPDDDSLEEERYFAERWERWKREKRELNALRGKWPQLSTDAILQMIRDGREERMNQLMRAMENRERLRQPSQDDPQ